MITKPQPTPRLLTMQQAATYCGMRHSKFYVHFPAMGIRRVWNLIDVKDLDAAIERQKQKEESVCQN